MDRKLFLFNAVASLVIVFTGILAYTLQSNLWVMPMVGAALFVSSLSAFMMTNSSKKKQLALVWIDPKAR